MKIAFIQTGGTIDKDYPRMTKGYAFEIADPAVRRVLEKIYPAFEFEIIALLQKDSLDINEEDRSKILETCRNTDSDKIIITHGTDTIIETARKLAVIKEKVIILTGAMRPERFSDSDADFNIGTAIGAANVVQNGIYVAMNGSIYPYDKVRRDIITGRFVEG
jgi:L-asparaginase